MDEYITRNNAISAVCFGCNQQFSNEPCEPSECTIRQSIMALPTADVVPKSEYDALAEQNESLEIELENMRRNLGDAREGWNDAEWEVERLCKINSILTEAGQEWQRRYYNAKAEVAEEKHEKV